MIKKMAIFVVIITVVLLAGIYQLVRLPKLDVPIHTSKAEKLSALDEWFINIHNKGKFNGVALLSKNGKVIFSKSYGFDGSENSDQLNEHSSFNLASVSKQFTAMGIVILNHQSIISYQDKLSKYIPELSFYPEITIQHLLHHTSGIPDYMMLAGKGSNRSDVFTTSKMISNYGELKPKLGFNPGSKFQYSNAGYVLLAEIIKRTSGKSFQEFAAENIFKPLNMNDTQVFNLLSEEQPIKRAYGFKYKYWLFGGKKVLNDLNYFDGVAGDGGVYSSAHDLNIWHDALESGALIPKSIYNEAYIPAQLDDNTTTNYGYGWIINEDNSVEHAGGWQGFTSYIYRNLKTGDLIVILDNSSNALRVNSIGFKFNSIGLNLKHFLKTL